MFSRREVEAHTRSPRPTRTLLGHDPERGAVLVEYAFVLMLVVFAAGLTLTLFGGAILDLYTNNAVAMSQAADAATAN